jgi:hypothetical protein
MTSNRFRHRVTAIAATCAFVVALVSPAAGSSGFGDTTPADFAAPAIQWMVDSGLTTGTSPGCFSPDQPMDRGQLAAFVWRYLGEPTGSGHPFTDVSSGDYFGEAVSWMYSTGLTTGTSATTYSPARVITRGELATFLWRLDGSKSAPASSFTDVDRSMFYARPIDWMVDRGYTTGTSAQTFSPDRTLSRAEFATFLYRFAGSPQVVVQPGGVCEATGVSDFYGVKVFDQDFTNVDAMSTLSTGVHHRDEFVVSQYSWEGDHASTGGVNCSAPEEKRTIHRDNPEDAIYMCHPGGNPDAGHVMTSIGDTAGYSWAWMTPNQSFSGVNEVRWDVNITDLGNRQFTEVMVVPAGNWDPYGAVPSLPCLVVTFAFPCDAMSYPGMNAIGTSSFNGQLIIATQDGSEIVHDGAPDSDPARTSIRERRTHYFRDNGNGTVTFGQEQENGSYRTVTADGSFPDGQVKVVFKDHGYTPLKSEFGFPRGEPTFTWHWDDLIVAVDGNSLGTNSLTSFGA